MTDGGCWNDHDVTFTSRPRHSPRTSWQESAGSVTWEPHVHSVARTGHLTFILSAARPLEKEAVAATGRPATRQLCLEARPRFSCTGILDGTGGCGRGGCEHFDSMGGGGWRTEPNPTPMSSFNPTPTPLLPDLPACQVSHKQSAGLTRCILFGSWAEERRRVNGKVRRLLLTRDNVKIPKDAEATLEEAMTS